MFSINNIQDNNIVVDSIPYSKYLWPPGTFVPQKILVDSCESR